MTPRFYCAMPLAKDTTIQLPEGPARHAVSVLRLRSGSAITLFNGEGGEFSATIEDVARRNIRARIESHHDVERESPLHVTLVQGLASVERMDHVVQKAVELGVTAIAPVETSRSVMRISGPRAERRREHWRQIAIAACEQCGRNRVPEIRLPGAFGDWLAEASPAARRLLLAPDATQSLSALEAPRGAIELLAGPEGGLSAGEAAAARRAGFRAVRLGPRVLRTETAGVAALAAINALWGDW
ncbi:MAG TPA: 16S rRNA (uracil(1498)-N(3))-methyltransferase [Casimicrobiaceae bacterium]|nr:16S rRNA (uracil(1498)-N(3))-methyltransferase [Casimicrobiaceae bacterium]